MSETRTYARKGFTTRKAIAAALAPFERRSRRKHQITLEGIAPAAIQKVVAALPVEQHADRHTATGPTLAEIIKLGTSIGNVTFDGYRVEPDRPDERISLTGFAIAAGEVNAARMRQIVKKAPSAQLAWVQRGDEAVLTVAW